MNNVRERICPICGGKFKGKAGLRQHMLASHQNRQNSIRPNPGPNQATQKSGRTNTHVGRRARRGRQTGSSPNMGNLPLRGANAFVSGNSGTRTETGSDIVTVMRVTAPSNIGAQLAVISIAPQVFHETRLKTVSQTFARWRPRRLRFSVCPSASSTTIGNYIVGWTPEVGARIPKGQLAIKRVAAMPVSREAHISTTVVIDVPCAQPSRNWYTCHTALTDEYDLEHGNLYIYLSAPIANLTGAIAFSIHLDWTIEFDGPVFTSPSDHKFIYADPGWSPYFTTSEHSIDAAVTLILKARSGGDACTFSSAPEQTVLRLDVDAKLPYYIAPAQAGGNPTLAYVKYGAVAKNWHSTLAYKYLVLFDTAAKAAAYVGAANHAAGVAQCLTYYQAGEYVKPDNPAWEALNSEYTDGGGGDEDNDIPVLDMTLRRPKAPSQSATETRLLSIEKSIRFLTEKLSGAKVVDIPSDVDEDGFEHLASGNE